MCGGGTPCFICNDVLFGEGWPEWQMSDGDVPCFIDSPRGTGAEEMRNYGVSDIAMLINRIHWWPRAVCQEVFTLTSQSLAGCGNWSAYRKWSY
jgi:hypothetical protein